MMTPRLPFALSYWSGDSAVVTTLKAGEDFRFDLDALNRFCLADLPRRLLDLLRIASAVYVVDRRVKRMPKGGPKPPSRTVGLKVEVLDHSIWNRSEVRDALHDALEFVTGDFWEIAFERDARRHTRPKPFLPFPKMDDSPLVCLYSSGLDSAAGLVARMNNSPGRPIVPVTVWHQPRQRHLVKQHFDFLRSHYRTKRFSAAIEPLIFKVAMIWNSRSEKRNQEASQRSRSFLFTALGAIAAVMCGQQTVEMFESGIGAINLPLMAGLVGWKATRSSHPEFLRRMSKLASLVADHEVKFALPFEDKTKAEVVEALAAPELRAFAAMSASCVHFPIRHKKYQQCGLCPACVFRRAALASAGIEEPDGTYWFDFVGPAERINALPDKRLSYLKAFLLQVSRLRDIENGNRLPTTIERHILATGIIQRGQSQKGVIELLVRYRDEWLAIASAARERGHAWANLIASQPPARPGIAHVSA